MTDKRRCTTHRVLATTIAAGLALVLAACTAAAPGAAGSASAGAVESAPPAASAGGTGSGEGGTKPDPCTLLEPADLEAQFGTAFQPGVLVGTTTAPHVECQWAKEGGFTSWLNLALDDLGSAGWGCLAGEPVSGVGDEACFGDVGLHVRHGAWDLVLAGVEGVTKEQLIELAKVADSRL